MSVPTILLIAGLVLIAGSFVLKIFVKKRCSICGKILQGHGERICNSCFHSRDLEKEVPHE